MNPTFILTLALVAIFTVLLVPALCARRRRSETVFANIAEGTHTDSITKLTDAAIATRYLLFKVGSDANHIAVGGATDLPLGSVADEASAAEEYVAVNLLGKGPTKLLVASEAMATTGVKVYAAASGKIALSGTVLVGTLLTTAAADGDVVEVSDCEPAVVTEGEVVTATNAIAASENGKTFFLNSTTEFVSTLPAPALGLRFRFIVSGAPSGASYTIVTNSSANVIKGHVLSSDLNNASDADFETSGGDTISFVDGAAVAGDWVEVESDGTTWFASGRCSAQGGITITTAS